MALSRVLRITVAVTLTAYLVWAADARAVWAAAHGADLIWIAAAVLLVLVDRALMAWRWIDLLAALTPGSRPPFPVVLRIFFVSTFVGSLLPSVGGDVYRAYSLARHDVRTAESAASVLMDRVLGVLSVVIVGAAALSIAPLYARDPVVIVALAAGGAGCVAAGMAIFSENAAVGLRRLAGRLPSAALGRVVASLTDAIRRYSNHRDELCRVLIASIAVQALRVLQAFCLGQSLGIGLSLGVYFAYIPIVLLVMLLPVTVQGLGTGQWAFSWLFSQVGVTPADAVALSLLFIALGIFGNVPGAILYAFKPSEGGRTSGTRRTSP